MQIGTKNDSIFVLEINLLEKDGFQELTDLITMLLEAEFVEGGEEHLQQCLSFARMLHEQRKYPN